MKKQIAIVILISIACVCMAQTNSVPDVMSVSNSVQAFSALLHFLGFSKEDIAIALVILHVAAKYVRNYLFAGHTTKTNSVMAKIAAIVSANPLEQPSKQPITAETAVAKASEQLNQPTPK